MTELDPYAARHPRRFDRPEDRMTTPPREPDPLLGQAAELVIRTRVAYVSLLQRRLNLSAPAASWLMGELERVGVVGPAEEGEDLDVLVPVAEMDGALARIRAGERLTPPQDAGTLHSGPESHAPVTDGSRATTAPPADGYRHRLARALIARIKQSVIIEQPYAAGMIGQPFAATEYDLADAALAVRDEEMGAVRARAVKAETERDEALTEAELLRIEVRYLRGGSPATAAIARVRALAESWTVKPDDDWANEMTCADAGQHVLAAIEGRES